MLNGGIITQEEYDAKKKQLLNAYSEPIVNNNVPIYQPPPQTNQQYQQQHQQKRGAGGVVAVILVVIILLVFINGINSGSCSGTSSGISRGVTLSQYNQIKTGMTYQEVVNIFGRQGELMVEMDIEGSAIKTYSWIGNGPPGSNVTISFISNKVSSKAQIGLK